ADLDPEPGPELAAAAGALGRYLRASLAPELGQSACLTGQFHAGGLGGQRGQDVGHGPQPGGGVRCPRKQRRQVGVRHDGLVLALRLRDVRHVNIRNVVTRHSVTPASAVIWASLRRPRCAATRTAPGLLRSIRATDSVSRPATTRSRITSAWRRGSPASRAIAAAVLRFSMAASAESALLGSCATVA